MARRSLSAMGLWEQRLKGSCSKWEGWSVRENRGRVLVAYRPRGGVSEQVLLPKDLEWAEGCEEDITLWIRRLYRTWNNGALSLRGALERLVPQSDNLGAQASITWEEIRDQFKNRLMTEGNRIELKSWETNYAVFIDEALRQLKAGKPKDGAALLRLTAKRWKDKPASRAVCISALKRFTMFAVREHHAPRSWLIDEYDAKSVRGNPDDAEKRKTATLTDSEILRLIAEIERKRPDWANVVRILAATGIRPTELEHLSVRKNSDGDPQLWCNYRKSGGRRKTQPRWLEELPLVADDGSVVVWNLAAVYKSMPYPLGRDGDRRRLSGHYVEQHLRDVPYWRELKAAYADQGLWLRSYSFRNTWNVRAHRLIGNEAAICQAMGNTPMTNARSYRQTDERTTREAFKMAVATTGSGEKSP